MDGAGDAWLRDGVRFECTRCGACCRGPGTVELSDRDIERLALALAISVEGFREAHTRPLYKGGIALRDKRNHDCTFYDVERGCTVYDARPAQCRAYPFWSSNLCDRESWEDEGERCEGIGRGPLLSREEALRRMRAFERGS